MCQFRKVWKDMREDGIGHNTSNITMSIIQNIFTKTTKGVKQEVQLDHLLEWLSILILCKFFTARVRTYDGRLCFHRCVSVQGGGVPGFSKGKSFWHQIWLDTCSGWEKKFLSRAAPPPPAVKGKIFDTKFGLIHVQTRKQFLVEGPPSPPVKGKIFDTRFGLIHVQTGKKIFVKGHPAPPPPPVRGKNFDTRFGLIHVQTGKKFLVEGPPLPPSKGKNFWHQIWLDTCSDRKKFFCQGPPPHPRNSKKLLWLRGGRYASCVHAGGLSCYLDDHREECFRALWYTIFKYIKKYHY